MAVRFVISPTSAPAVKRSHPSPTNINLELQRRRAAVGSVDREVGERESRRPVRHQLAQRAADVVM